MAIWNVLKCIEKVWIHEIPKVFASWQCLQDQALPSLLCVPHILRLLLTQVCLPHLWWSSCPVLPSQETIQVRGSWCQLIGKFKRVLFRMASSFELSSDQPALYYQRARKLTGNKKDSIVHRFEICVKICKCVSKIYFFIAANSYQNLFGEPTERHRPLSKKVSKLTPPEPRSRKQKPLPG